MWTLGTSAPDFRVATPQGAVGPEDFRGSWFALLHCGSNPSALLEDCGELRELARGLARLGCRLLVASDDDALARTVGACSADAPVPWRGGAWLAQGWPRGATTPSFVLVDPDGTVRAVTEGSAAVPLTQALILETLELALGGTFVRPAVPATAEECFGCVDWFDYDEPPGDAAESRV